MKRVSILEAFESIIGEQLTPANAKQFSQAPVEQVRDLLEKLTPYYGIPVSELIDDYFDPERVRTPFYFSIDPELLQSEYVNAAEIQRFAHVSGQFRNSLLYLERVALPDPFDFLFARPLADLIRGTDEVNAFYGESDGMLEEAWSAAVTFLAAVAPLIRARIVSLVPYRWLSDFTSVNRAMLQGALSTSDAVIVPRGAFKHVNIADAIGSIGSEYEREAIADAIALYDLLTDMNLTPLARTETGRRALDVITALEGLALSGRVEAAAAGVLVQNQLPGVARIPIEMIVALRQDDEAFHAWRTSFSEVMARAQILPFTNEAQYRADLTEAADDLLKPKILGMDKSLNGSHVFRDLFKPSGLQIGVGGLVALVSHSPWGLLGVAGTALVKFGVSAVNKKIGRSARREATLRDLYAYVVTAPKAN
ncbi:MAG TPA: hypothetical protein VGU66_09010 [Candidatus Elarobacter sp.]|nr:hypothetical protein [Candidatus Elarobacter sp.]